MLFRTLSLLLIVSLFISCQSGEQSSAPETKTQEQRRDPVNLSTQVISNPRTANQSGAVDKWAEMRFDRYDHSFGEIKQGVTVETHFEFTNTGTADLIIFSAKGTCGCTVPDYPRQPIAPGETGKIKVTYDSSNRTGFQEKTVNITANTNPNVITLRLESQVTL